MIVDKINAYLTQKNTTLDEALRSEVEKLANGLTYIGTDALSYGLIDAIGDMTSATKYLEEQIGEKVEFCWY